MFEVHLLDDHYGCNKLVMGNSASQKMGLSWTGPFCSEVCLSLAKNLG